MDNLKPTIQTVIAPKTFINAANKVFNIHFGTPPKNFAKLLCSQFVLETGWSKSCFQFNTGNIKYTPGCGHDYQYLKNVFEYEKGVKVYYQPPSHQCQFRAYDSILDGVTDHILLLQKRPAVWNVMINDTENVYNFCLALSRCKYYSAPLDQYFNAVNSIFNSFHSID